MTKKKAYYGNKEIMNMIEEGLIDEVLSILKKQIPRGQNRSLFQGYTRYGWRKYRDVDANILLVCKDIVDWDTISEDKLTLNHIEILFDYLNIDTICSNNNDLLDSIEFVDKYKDRLNFTILCKNRTLTKDFIERFREYIDFEALSINCNIKFSDILHFVKEIDINTWIKNANKDYYSRNINPAINNIDNVAKLLKEGLIDFDSIVYNSRFCNNTLLEDLVDNKIYSLTDKDYKTIAKYDYYNDFIYKNLDKYDTKWLLNSYNHKCNSIWKYLSTNIIEKIYDPEKYPGIALDILSNNNKYSSSFLYKYKNMLSFDIVDSLCRQNNLDYTMVKEIDTFVNNGNRKSFRYRSIIRSHNELILDDYEELKKIMKLLQWNKNDFNLLIKRVINENYRHKHTIEEYFDIIEYYSQVSKYSEVEVLTKKNYILLHIHLSDIDKNKESQKLLKEFFVNHIKKLNEFPSGLLGINIIKEIISIEFIIENVIKKKIKISNINSLSYYYTFSQEHIKTILENVPMNLNEKTKFINNIADYQHCISDVLFIDYLLSHTSENRFTIFTSLDILKNNKELKKEAIEFLYNHTYFEVDDEYYRELFIETANKRLLELNLSTL